MNPRALLKVVPSRHQSACGFYFTTDLTDWTDECPMGGWKQDINQDKPLGEDGGRCPCCYASALVLLERALNAQTESIPPPSLQKVTILAKAINRNKPTHPMAYCPPGRCSSLVYTEGVAPSYSR